MFDAGPATSNDDARSAGRAAPAGDPTKAGRVAQSPWPLNLGDVTPLEWWRTMPADHLGESQRLHLRSTLDKVCVLKDRQWLSALRGDAPASIAIAIGAMTIAKVTLEVDLAMSALVLCALDGSAGAALVLSHILRRTALDHPFGKDLSAAWLALNLGRAMTAKRRAAKPRLRSNTSIAPNYPHIATYEAVQA